MTHRDPVSPALSLAWSREHDSIGYLELDCDFITISGGALPAPLRYWYLETFLRRSPLSSEDVGDFVEKVFMKHSTDVIAADGRCLHLRTVGDDGPVVDGIVEARDDEVDVVLTAHNPTDEPVNLQWGSSCLQVADFTGVPYELEAKEYLAKSFIFVDGEVFRLTEAAAPRQGFASPVVEPGMRNWLAPGRSIEDMHPDLLPWTIGVEQPTYPLIGCFSADESVVVAEAWEPCQTLTAARLCCLHASPQFGGLEPGETKTLRGKIYVASGIDDLLTRYRRDFPAAE